MPPKSKGERKQQILETLTQMLEQTPTNKITTAQLAARVGVSEAALYRHFPSKAKMYEALIEFSEETLFSRISGIYQEPFPVDEKCYRILAVALTFTERNPGICRLLAGDALAGEIPRLGQRVHQLFERLETQLKQLLREAEYREKIATSVTGNEAANLLVAIIEGKIRQFIRSGFNRRPMEQWQSQWQPIRDSLFVPVPHPGP